MAGINIRYKKAMPDMVPVAYERSENFMQKEKNDELSKMFSYAGNYHKLTILGCIYPCRNQHHLFHAAFCLYLVCDP